MRRGALFLAGLTLLGCVEAPDASRAADAGTDVVEAPESAESTLEPAQAGPESPEAGPDSEDPATARAETANSPSGTETAGAETATARGDAAPEPDSATVDPVEASAAQSVPDSGPDRPAMEMDATGPMIHPEAPGARTDFEDARFPRPEHVRGLYVNAWAAGSSRRMDELLEIVRTTEINSLVIDIKDATGFVSHASNVPAIREVGATGEIRIRDLPGLLDRLEAEGVYPIARIVVVKDPLLSRERPELAIQDTAGGVWIDSKEIIWLNPYARGVWEYHVDLAREVAEMGFPEIQWDYIRFPDAPASDYARALFPGSAGMERADAIRGFLTYARKELADLPVRSTADVFGVTTSFRRDIGIGQLWESFIDVVDVALPMVYPSHYWEGSFGYAEPNAYPYEIVRDALEDALSRSARVEGAGLTRPWIQDFTLGPPAYGAAEVRAQIQATYDVGIEEWIIWNPSTRYTVAALEPVGGFAEEPEVRVAGVLAPVSRRHAVIDSVAAVLAAAEAEAAARAAAEEESSEGEPESAEPAAAVPDTVRSRPSGG